MKTATSMAADGHAVLADHLRPHLQPLDGAPGQYDALLRLLAGSRFALLGEASHGTHDFYRARADITQRLVMEYGFSAVVVEADWTDAWRVNRYVRGRSDDADATAALGGFQRFPQWMWRNTVVRDFVEWLRAHNAGRAPDAQVGFYGMDLYSLSASIEAVLAYLDRTDAQAAARARLRYACFDHAAGDGQAYGQATHFGLRRDCEDAVVHFDKTRALQPLDGAVEAPGRGRGEPAETFPSGL